MHCPAGHLLPGPNFITELLPPHPETFANTCHPLSITKSPVVSPWCPQNATNLTMSYCPQSATNLTMSCCPQSATNLSTLPFQPLVQKCFLLCPDSCETAQLLPSVPQISEGPQSDKKRVARSLPPCATRCPQPARLRFPPCGIRGSSSASCCGQCRSYKVPKCPPSCPEVSGRYSAPLRGVTECPPQGYSFLPGDAVVAPHWCSKGYPTQEFVTCYSSEQRLSSVGGAVNGTQECPQIRAGVKGTQECPPLRGVAKECPQIGGVTKECPPLRGVAKECPPLRGVTKECPQLRTVTKGTKECHQFRAGTKECPQLRAVTKGTKECHQFRAGTKECPQLRAVTKGTKECPQLRGVVKECHQLRAVTKECPQLRGVTKVTKECSPLRAVTKECSQLRGVVKGTKECPQLRTVTKVTKECPPLRAVALLEGTKGRSCSAPQLSRSRCPQHPRGTPRPSRLTTAGVKRSGHSKKSRCASKWLW